MRIEVSDIVVEPGLLSFDEVAISAAGSKLLDFIYYNEVLMQFLQVTKELIDA
jgi:hypothetical protein